MPSSACSPTSPFVSTRTIAWACSTRCAPSTPTRDFRREWDFAETLAIGDKATGTDVLTRQYEAMRHEPETTDLAALWRDLGISAGDHGISFDDTAPLAAVRRAIETPV